MKTLSNPKNEIWLVGAFCSIMAAPIFVLFFMLVRNFFAFYLSLDSGEQTIINWFVAGGFFSAAAFVIYLIKNNKQ